MAADIGIKIDAVFSLVGPDETVDVSEQFGQDCNDLEHAEAIVDDAIGSAHAQYDLLSEMAIGGGVTSEQLDESADSTIDERLDVMMSKSYINFDAPPPLFLESNGPSPFDNDNTTDLLPPPVLEPEEPIQEPPTLHADMGTIPRKRCIAPCYIALTTIQPLLKGKTTISFRQIKKFKECLNICKKVHFTRQLNKGKDVFNVKVGQKWKECNIETYLDSLKNKSVERNGKHSPVRCTSLVSKCDKKKGRQASMVKSPKIDRVRRKISRLPKDFDWRFMNTLNRESLILSSHSRLHSDGLTDAERLKEREDIQRQIEESKRHLSAVQTLRKQITLKRKMNKRTKSLRKVMTKANENIPFYCKETTSSFSGRARKPNKRYSQEGYVMTNHEMHFIREEHKQKDIMRKELKLLEERKKKDENRVKRWSIEAGTQKPPAIDIVIDNPEKSEVLKLPFPKIKHEPKPEQRAKKIMRKRKRDTSSEKTNESLGDSVLIRDLPSDDSVIRGMLMGSTADNTSDSYKVNSDVAEPLGYKADTRREFDRDPMTNEALMKDKFEKFKIPKSVQRLFQSKRNDDQHPEKKSETALATPSLPRLVKVSKTGNVLTASLEATSEPDSKSILLTKMTDNQQVLLAPSVLRDDSTQTSQGITVQPKSESEVKGLVFVKFTDRNGGTILRAFNTTDSASLKSKDSGTGLKLSPVKPESLGSNMTQYLSTPTAPPISSSVMTTKPIPRQPIITYAKMEASARAPCNSVSLLQPSTLTAPPSNQPQPSIITATGTSTRLNLVRQQTQPSLRPIIRPPVQTVTTATKNKFYLLNVDGKNILVPINANPTEPPRAYVFGGEQGGGNMTSLGHTQKSQNFSALSPVEVDGVVSSEKIVSIQDSSILTPGTQKLTSLVRPKVELPTASGSDGNVRSSVSVLSRNAAVSTVSVTNMTSTTDIQAGDTTGRSPGLSTNRREDSSVFTAKTVKTEKIDEEFDNIENMDKSIESNLSDADSMTDSASETHDSPTKKVDKDVVSESKDINKKHDEPKAFAEAVSAREERLKRLKELIKEKNAALEALRSSKN